MNTDYCGAHDIPIVRRPTGGRAILHGDDLTYSFSSPCHGPFGRRHMDTYLLLGAAFVSFFKALGLDVEMQTERERRREAARSPLCFASLSPGEIRCRGRKIAGAAQRRWSDGFLQQGTIPYRVEVSVISSVFRHGGSSDSDGPSGVPQATAGLREMAGDIESSDIKTCLISGFETTFHVTLEEALPSPREEELTLRLCQEKYWNPRWVQGAVRQSRS